LKYDFFQRREKKKKIIQWMQEQRSDTNPKSRINNSDSNHVGDSKDNNKDINIFETIL